MISSFLVRRPWTASHRAVSRQAIAPSPSNVSQAYCPLSDWTPTRQLSLMLTTSPVVLLVKLLGPESRTARMVTKYVPSGCPSLGAAGIFNWFLLDLMEVLYGCQVTPLAEVVVPTVHEDRPTFAVDKVVAVARLDHVIAFLTTRGVANDSPTGGAMPGERKAPPVRRSVAHSFLLVKHSLWAVPGCNPPAESGDRHASRCATKPLLSHLRVAVSRRGTWSSFLLPNILQPRRSFDPPTPSCFVYRFASVLGGGPGNACLGIQTRCRRSGTLCNP